MGSQTRRIARLTEIGVPDDEKMITLVLLLEELLRVGDDMADVIWPWEEGDVTFVTAYDGAHHLLDHARYLLEKIAETVPQDFEWKTKINAV